MSNIMDNAHIIHTGLYSNVAKEMLDSIFGQMSDGMWENSPSMDKYWRFARTEQLPDGEVVIKISTKSAEYGGYRYTHNGFFGMDDAKVMDFLGHKLKAIAIQEIKDDNLPTTGSNKAWRRDNQTDASAYLSYHEDIKIAHIYYLYERLLNRNAAGKYLPGIVSKVVGTKRSDEETNAVKTKQAKEQAINAEFSAKLKMIDDEYAKAKEAMLKALNEKYSADRLAALADHKVKLAAIGVAA